MLCLLLLPAAPGKSPQEESCPQGSGTRLGQPESQEQWFFCFHHFLLCPLPLLQPSSGYLLPPFRYTPNCSKSTTPQELLLCCLPLGCCSSSSNASNWKKHPYHRSLLMKEQLRESQAHLHLINIFLCTALQSFPLSLFGKCRRGKKKHSRSSSSCVQQASQRPFFFSKNHAFLAALLLLRVSPAVKQYPCCCCCCWTTAASKQQVPSFSTSLRHYSSEDHQHACFFFFA